MIWLFVAFTIDCSFCQPTNSFNENPVVEESSPVVEYDYTMPEAGENETQPAEETEKEKSPWDGTVHWGTP